MPVRQSPPRSRLMFWGMAFIAILAVQVLVGDEVRGFVDGLHASFMDGV